MLTLDNNENISDSSQEVSETTVKEGEGNNDSTRSQNKKNTEDIQPEKS